MNTWSTSHAKRSLDLLGSMFAIFLLLPILLSLYFLVFLVDGRPVIFQQERLGYKSKIFIIYKFRTMINNQMSNSLQLTTSTDNRITFLGYYLRKFKLDELPQLFNVFLGDMSFVGPRPEVPKYLPYYSNKDLEAFNYRPGITDPASLRFINESTLLSEIINPHAYYTNQILPEKLKINIIYSRQSTFLSDIIIIIRTILKSLSSGFSRTR